MKDVATFAGAECKVIALSGFPFEHLQNLDPRLNIPVAYRLGNLRQYGVPQLHHARTHDARSGVKSNRVGRNVN
jgi:hypothetical protein